MRGGTSQVACIKEMFWIKTVLCKTGTDISKLKPCSPRGLLLLGINRNLDVNAGLSGNTEGLAM